MLKTTQAPAPEERTSFLIRQDVLYLPLYSRAATGCKVLAFDLINRRELWKTELFGIGDCVHSKYWNHVHCRIQDNTIVVYGDEAGGQYIEVVDINTGQTIGNRGYSRGKRIETWELGVMVLLALQAIAAVGVVSEVIIRRKRAQP